MVRTHECCRCLSQDPSRAGAYHRTRYVLPLPGFLGVFFFLAALWGLSQQPVAEEEWPQVESAKDREMGQHWEVESQCLP